MELGKYSLFSKIKVLALQAAYYIFWGIISAGSLAVVLYALMGVTP